MKVIGVKYFVSTKYIRMNETSRPVQQKPLEMRVLAAR
jgi:hypothetical protein